MSFVASELRYTSMTIETTLTTLISNSNASKYLKNEKEIMTSFSFSLKIFMYYIQKISFSPKQPSVFFY